MPFSAPVTCWTRSISATDSPRSNANVDDMRYNLSRFSLETPNINTPAPTSKIANKTTPTIMPTPPPPLHESQRSFSAE